MIKVTNEQVLIFRQNAAKYRQPYAGKFSPFLYAIQKMVERTQPFEEEYYKDVTDINRSFAAKDKDGFYIPGENSPYKIKADTEPERDEKVRELLKSNAKATINKIVVDEIEPFITPQLWEDLPKDIDFQWWSVLSPFVLPPIDDEILEKLYQRDKKK